MQSSTDKRIFEGDALTREAIDALLEDRVLAVRIRNYCPSELCEQLADWYVNHPDRTDYTGVRWVKKERKINGKPVNAKSFYEEADVIEVQYGVDRIGIPLNTTYKKPDNSPEVQRYYAEALRMIADTRSACLPHVSPVDQLRVELDDLVGARLARHHGKPLFCGIGRVTLPNRTELEKQPHFDAVPDIWFDQPPFLVQMGVNVYLETPDSGGEIEIFDHAPFTSEELDMAEPDTDWRAVLGESILVKPEKGDLIFLNSRRAHAVRHFSAGQRVSMHFFLGYRDIEHEGSPKFVIWS